jgi:16S rRNA (guanine527-N7)-methyltransferase
MIEQLSRAAGRPVSRETYDRLGRYVGLLAEANRQQNLVAGSTMDAIWDRHILDSAQLAQFEPAPDASWIDIGSGAGLPGVVIACIVSGPVTLVEPRRLRVKILHSVIDALDLDARVEPVKAERVTGHFGVITGRAVANLSDFLTLSLHLSTKNTVWALPKGRNAQSELAQAQAAWQGVFHVEPSVTDADSRIIVATEVRAKSR